VTTSNSQLQGAGVTVESERFAVDLKALAQRTGLGAPGKADAVKAALPEAPAVSLQGMADVHVDTGGLSLKDVLGAADSGKATVRIPLVPQAFKVGPFSVDIEAGARIVLDVVVSPGGVIERAQTRGRLEPGLKLPLGVVVNGVYVDQGGNVVADVDRFPDVNLSLLALHGLRVPESLPALLELVFAPAAPPSPSSSEPKPDEPSYLDLGGIEVDASDVRCRQGALRLGAGLSVASGDHTRLDIGWGHGRLRLRGVVDVVEAAVRQPGFALEGVSGSGRLDFSVDVNSGAFSLALDEANARVGRARVEVGDSVVEVEDVGTVAAATVAVERAADPAVALVFSAALPGLDGRLTAGHVGVDVGDRRVPLTLKPGHASGSVTVTQRHHTIDLTVKDVGLVVDDVGVALPLVSLHVQQAAARASGRLRAATDLGVAFSGAVSVDAVLDEAVVDAGPVTARGGGSAHIVVDDVATGPSGLELLHLQGSLELSLQSGRVPLFSTSLEVLPGAHAAIVLDKVALGADEPAHVEGSVVVEASAATCVVDPVLLTVPESACRLTVPRFVVDGSLLVAERLHASIKTR
jgi:hypothetical protein